MKKLTVLSIVAASLLLVGCNESSTGAEAKAATETTHEVAKTAEAHASNAADEAKAAAAVAVEKTKTAVAEKATEVKEAVAEKAAEVKDAVAEKAAAATAAVTGAATAAASAVAEKATEAVAAATGPDGKALFAKCAGCHGADGKTAALGKSAVIAGQAAADLETKINGYKAGTLNTAGMGALMKGQVASYSDEDIKAVSAFISGL